LKPVRGLLSGRATLAFFVIFFFTFASTSLAQSDAGKISGYVEDGSGQPLSSATVVLAEVDGESRHETTSDTQGLYEFSSLPSGDYRLEVSASGHLGQARDPIRLEEGVAVEVNFRLQAMRTTIREAEERGARERNPNIFIRKVDLNALRDPLRRRGIETVFLEPEATENQFLNDMGAPMRQILFVQPRGPIRQFHASLYGAHENSALNARPFFNVGPLRSSKRNQFGASASGSLIADKLFFTTSLDFVSDSGFVNGNIRSPLPSERTPTAEDPETAAIVAGLLQAYPAEDPNLPNVAARQLNTNAIRRIDSVDWNLKLDYLLSDRDNLAFQYTLFDYSEDPFEFVVGGNPKTDLRPQTFSTTHVHNWSPATILQSSFQFARLSALLLLTDGFRSLLEPLGLEAAPDVDFGGNLGDLNHIGPGTQFPRERFQNRFSGNVDVSHLAGKHQFRFGGRTTRTQINDLQSDNSRGQFTFTSNFGRTAVENFLEGTATKFTLTLGDLYRGFRTWEQALYVQDSYQMRPGFTVNLGLRYEIVTVPSEVNGRTQFDYETDANNFAPHLALAWAPGGGDTVIRAGYGISFGHIFPGTYQLARFNPPAVSTITVQNPSLSDPLEGVSTDPGEVQRSELRLLSPDLVSSYGHQYNLVIQRRLSQNLFFQIGYVGNRTHKLYFPFVSNRAEPVPGIPATLETIDERRPDQRFFDVQTVINSGTAYYDGLKVGLTRSLTHGLAFGVNYFFSKSLSNTTDFATTLNREIAFLFNQHNQDFHADLRGPTPFDHRHILTVRYSYDFPFEFSNGLLSTLLEGWQIAGVSEYRTGLWYRIKSSSDAPGFGNVDGVRDDRPNVVNPDILGKTFDNPDTAPDLLKPEFFNTDVPAGGGGDSPFFGFRRAPINNTNLALTKSFTLFQRERLLQFRMEARNMLNRAWFGRPGDIFPSEVFGKIIHTQNKGRVIQFMIRLNF